MNWRSVLFNVTFALNCMLLFLVLFESRLALPAWLQVVGRMHPLLLHFPLVLVVVYAVLPRSEAYKNLLLITAFTSVLTAIMGLFLSREEGYGQEALQWHKWGGVTVSVFTLLWYRVPMKKPVTLLTSVVALLLIVVTGHLGASITHGDNFLLAPIDKPTPVPLTEAKVYEHLVKPILQQKCMGCHNSSKAKGELVMETEALLLKGGKNGKLWDTAAADLGLMLHRVHLPMEQKEHMPPKQKPQLTDEEIEILTQWIRKGSSFDLRVADLAATDTLYQIAQSKFAAPEYDFPEPDAAVVSKLNTVNRVVNFESKGSPALVVNFFNSNLFKSEQLNELKAVRLQIVSLDLSQMPLKDADIKTISEFENLRQLNLSFTGIDNVTELAKLRSLQSLGISGTKVTAKQLQGFTSLKTLYAWNTSIEKNDLPNLRVETGSQGDTSVMKLSPPVALNEERFITDTPIVLKLKNYIQGAVIHFTTDGSEPDSIRAAIFRGNERLDSNVTIRAKAYKPGWISSDVMEVSFLKNTYTPDSVIYLAKPNEKYQDPQGKLLIDHEKGENDFRFGGWVAFRENKMECMLPFSKPVNIQSIGLSSMVDVGAFIMPPALIEIWGGNDPGQLKLLGQLKPQQPGKVIPAVKKSFDCKFKTASVSYIKIVAIPIVKLPSWHPGKGDKAWFFIDEIMVN